MALSSAHSIFIDHYVEHGDATEAYEAAGFRPDKSNAKRLLNKLAPYINDTHQKRMASFAGVALAELERIISGEDTHARDKINAVNSYLDRCGIARASTVNMTSAVAAEPKKPVKRVTGHGSIEVDYSTNPDLSLWLPELDREAGEPRESADLEWDMSDPTTAAFLGSKTG